MPVNLIVPHEDDIFPVRGMRLGVTQAGIKKANRDDLTVMVLDEGANVAGVFTKNRFCAAPVQVCRRHLEISFKIRALVINTGCANAGTGELGLEDAKKTCLEVAKRLNINDSEVLPFSTGVIMEPLPMAKLIGGLDACVANAKENNWLAAGKAIMTTDTLPKISSRQIKIKNELITVTGISKGAGMICPNMATMLGFIATDASLSSALMKSLVEDLANHSFNRITVDGDTSTNDSFILIATNKAECQVDSLDSSEGKQLSAALLAVAQDLAKAIVRDGEGATKLITVEVNQGATQEECLKVAYSIAHSPLVKTAFFASDPNLGRILCAIGYAGILDLDAGRINLYLGDVLVVENGGRASSYLEEMAQKVMNESEILIRVELGRGDFSETVWTCDLNHDYVSINADYRS